jgi:cytochrome b-561
MGKGKYDEIMDDDRRSVGVFTFLAILTQIVGLIMVILVGVWMGNYRGGFAWSSNPSLQFNYHPLFMTMGFIFFYGDSILLYRVFRNQSKIYVKITHGLMHVFALIFSTVGLKAVFDSHNLANPPIPNLYSLHSWFGLIVLILFCLQWLFGFISFLYPKLSEDIRKAYLPAHRLWGIIIFIMACATALMGITEKAIFSLKDYKDLPTEGKVLNMFGLMIALFCGLVVYLVTKYDYRRPPEVDDHKPLEE